jgi:dinuclear metal center YbgI/SA1388 family protein
MPVDINIIELYLNDFLKVENFRDYCPNGLQISGSNEISKIVTGVTASQDLIDIAIEKKADAVLVHHGYFWKGESPCLLGIKRNRIASLLENNINLMAYHLPLDAHPTLGNNVLFGKSLGLETVEVLNDGLLYIGQFPESMDGASLKNKIGMQLQRDPQHLQGHSRQIQKVAWCTGAGQDYIEQAAKYGIDAFISGEVSERTFHAVNEYEIDYFSAGHHATECFGIAALGKHLAEHFQVDVEFVNIINPI